ncbi:MAG: FecR domain-containing protein [Gemmatimonadota bacterium]|nr:FecR domain-containing protein [Gemmatimonadota bacterium]
MTAAFSSRGPHRLNAHPLLFARGPVMHANVTRPLAAAIAALLLGALPVAGARAAHAQGVAEYKARSAELRVSVGNTTGFTTELREGWRSNGTGFTAATSGTGAVPVTISIKGIAGVSYEDYKYDVTVTTGSDDTPLLKETGSIPVGGGSKSFTVTWDPRRNPGAMAVHVGILGWNPDRFGFFVDGTVSTGKPVPMPPPLLQPTPAPPVAKRCRSGTGYSGAHFSGLTGQVSVRPDARPDAWITAKLDTELCTEDHIKTDDESTAILSLADMSTFILRPQSEVIVVTPPEKMSKVALAAGNIWTNVRKMMKDGTMEIDLNQAVTGIKGTTLALSTSPLASTVQVFEGTVEFRSKATGATVLVHAGESITATARGFSPVTRFDIARETAAWNALGASGASGGGATSPAPHADLSGTWAVSFDGGARTPLELRQSGPTVTGTLRAPDNSRGGVTGMVDGTTLLLSRDTGLETIQRYRLTVDGDRFTGRYANEGRYPGQGAFDGIRAPAIAPSVTGTWSVTFSGRDQTTLSLRQAGSQVSGTMRTPDNSRGAVTGTFDGTTLLLSRDTGLETVQHYRVTVAGDRFTGTFVNEGRYPDSGRFAGVRLPSTP